MKNKSTFSFLIIAYITISFCGCKKESKRVKLASIITIIDSNSIFTNSAIIKGIITSKAGGLIVEKGICWNIFPNPTIDNFTDRNVENNDTFQCNAISLNSSTNYFVRAFVVNEAGVSYGNELSFTTNFVCGDKIKDIDGNVYNTININGQCWMKENLTTTKYNDGTPITTELNNTQWSTTSSGAYAFYDDNITYNNTYGKVYNWYTVNTGKLAPKGWHIPTYSEWNSMISFIGADAGSKMKSSYLWNNSIANTNSSGFSALPGGKRTEDGNYVSILNYIGFWSSTSDILPPYAYFILLGTNPNVIKGLDSKRAGRYIRCIKD